MPKRVSDGLNLDGDDELSAHDVDDYNDEFSAHDRDSAEGKGSTPPLSPLKVLQTRAVKRAKPMFTTEFIPLGVHPGQHRGAPQSARRDRDRQSDAVGRPITDARQRHPAEQGRAGEARVSEKPRSDQNHVPGGLRQRAAQVAGPGANAHTALTSQECTQT